MDIKTIWCLFNKLTKIISSFEGANMLTEYKVLGIRMDLYFRDYKLAKTEID